MSRHICIHGHFYQPPRENAWLEEIEFQESAAPYHDWNERISAECYAPNAASRILDHEDRIIDIVNNYARISFDAGPTLLGWMERSAPDVYQAVLRADRESRERFHGHGSAIAQAFNHLILPLANSRDKRTQILWGLKDFESRFGRRSEGLWLPETAVDLESLDIAAELGVAFTILSPYQALRVRKTGAGEWSGAAHGAIDPRRPYLCRLPSGRSIAVFFYDGPISHDIAFGRLLENGEGFAGRLLGAFSAETGAPELVHVATDGETYGHHHRFGDMALAYGLRHIEKNRLAEITVYADYLERFPPDHEVEIQPNTAWSCAHGVERWRSDCGDSSGAHARWNQKWRAPLREAMEWLRDQALPSFEKTLSGWGADPWRARDDYIAAMLDRSAANVEAFLARAIPRRLGPPDRTKALKLLEIQRHAMLIFTSDGWFFDDISNVETVQVIQYAARAMQLLRDVTGVDLEPEFTTRLAAAKSNLPARGDGAKIYEKLVRPSMVDFPRLAAHFGVSSLFEDYPQAVKIAHYDAASDVCDRETAGPRRLALGRVRLRSEITWQERTLDYAVLHFGDHNLTAGVKESKEGDSFDRFCREAREAFNRGDMTAVLALIDRQFGGHSYSLWHLFKDERRKVVTAILENNLKALDADFRRIFEANRPIMEVLKRIQLPMPESLLGPAEFVLDADFRALLAAPETDFAKLDALVAEYRKWSIVPDNADFGYLAGRRLESLMARWAERPQDRGLLKAADRLLAVLKPLEIEIDLWKSQNLYVSRGRAAFADNAKRAAGGDAAAKEWLAAFEAAGASLRVSPAIFETR
jgi:alpha-amylase/alpha-mannosidase (GH57 family)